MMYQRVIRNLSTVVSVTAVLIVGLIAVACSGGQQPHPFDGTTLTGGKIAPAFTLQNQFGETASLSDFAEDVVLLTFLYTNCPDVCPIVTSQLRDTYALLAEDGANVSFVAVSVDPDRDTVSAAHDFSDRWDMTDNWSFLVGSREELAPIWKNYFVDPAIDDRGSGNGETPSAAVEAQLTSRAAVNGPEHQIGDQYLVIHSTPIFLIDREGVMRVLFTQPLDPDDIVHDIRLLLQ